jgi:hypothetical protein
LIGKRRYLERLDRLLFPPRMPQADSRVIEAWISGLPPFDDTQSCYFRSSPCSQLAAPVPRGTKRKLTCRGALHSNMDPVPPVLPLPPAKKGRGSPKKKNQRDEEQTPKPRRTARLARSAAATQNQTGSILQGTTGDAEDDESSYSTSQSAYAAALQDKLPPAAALPSRSQSSVGGSNTRSRSPAKSMADLYLGEKPVRNVELGSDSSQLPVDIRNMWRELKAFSNGIGVLPSLIEVSRWEDRRRSRTLS